jgi:uncharacterized protein
VGTNASRLGTLCEQITEIEGHADDIHNEGLRSLYRTARDSADPMAFISGQEVYHHLEMVADRFDDIGNEIQSIVLEQA